MKKLSSRLAAMLHRIESNDRRDATVGEIVDKAGPAGLELTLLALTFLTIIPGPSAFIVGALIFLIGIQALAGAERLRLPAFIRARSVRSAWLSAGLAKGASAVRRVEERLGPRRLWPLTERTTRSALAVPLLVMAVALTLPLPLPFANLAPAVSLIVIALGLVVRDGVAVLLGWLASLFALAWTGALVWQSKKLIEWTIALFA
jgi:hypothetical protein